MKTKTLLFALVLLGLFSCKNKNRSEEIASYAYSSEVNLSKVLDERVGGWIEEGLDCYGIIIMYDDNKNIIAGKPIKAKTLVITEKAIKMKALETVTLAPTKTCTKLGLEKGDTWWENNGDLFQTQEQALAYLKKLNSANTVKKDGHFTVD